MSIVFNSGDANAPARKIQQRSAAQSVIQSADGIAVAQGCQHGWIAGGPVLSHVNVYQHAADAATLDLSAAASVDYFLNGLLIQADTQTANTTVTMPTAATIHSRINASHYLELPTSSPSTADTAVKSPCFEFSVVNLDAAQTFILGAATGLTYVGSSTVAAATTAHFRCFLSSVASVPNVLIVRVD